MIKSGLLPKVMTLLSSVPALRSRCLKLLYHLSKNVNVMNIECSYVYMYE